MAGIAITRTDLTAEALRAASSNAPSIPAARRMLALALVLEGADRASAARSCGMDRQTLRDWVHRYNAEGLAGLSDRKAPGRAAKLTPEQKQELAALVEVGPDVANDGVVRWRRIDLQARIKALFGVEMHERTVGKHLARTRLRAALGASAASQGRRTGPGGFQKNFAARVEAVLPEHARNQPLEIWFQDEARVGQQGTLTRLWARKGTRPRAPRDQRYKWAYLFGAACPQRGASAALVLPTVNTTMMSLHLAEIARQVVPGSHAILVLDGAGYHGTAKTRRPRGLVVPDTITLLHLPASSPELNPMELVWQYLRQNKLANRVFRDYRHIVDACCDAWNFVANNPDTIASITKREWAQVNL